MRLEAHLTTIGTFGRGVRGETGSTSDYNRYILWRGEG